MMILNRIGERARDRRGIALVLVAGGAIALFSIVALAVDFGMLASARTEAQRVADLSALAGAGALAQTPLGGESLARQEAVNYAALNHIRNTAAVVEPGDVAVDLTNLTVTVTVYRTAERGNPMPTWFARVLGVTSVDVSARAVAEASDAGEEYAVNCLLPLAMPDRWLEEDGGWPDPANDTFDPGAGDAYDPGTTGYNESDYGAEVYLRSASGGGGDINPSWYFPWTPAEYEQDLEDTNGPGGDRYRDRFTSCLFGTFSPGDVVKTEPGAMVGPTTQGFEGLEDLDPTAYWDPGLNGGNGCVTRGSGCVLNSPRIRSLPLFDPRFPPDNGRSNFTISNFAMVFYEGKQGNRYYGRLMGLVAAGGGEPGGGGSTGPLVKVIRLIE